MHKPVGTRLFICFFVLVIVNAQLTRDITSETLRVGNVYSTVSGATSLTVTFNVPFAQTPRATCGLI